MGAGHIRTWFEANRDGLLIGLVVAAVIVAVMLILREFGHWRLLRLPDGTSGWMHRGLLTRERRFVVVAKGTVLRAAPQNTARPVAQLHVGVTGKLGHCDATAAWCTVTSHGYDGFVHRSQIWGSDADAP